MTLAGGGNMEGEGRQRKVGMVGDKVHGEAVPFTFP